MIIRLYSPNAVQMQAGDVKEVSARGASLFTANGRVAFSLLKNTSDRTFLLRPTAKTYGAVLSAPHLQP